VTLVIGHKGAAGRAAENTLDAFVAARALGADGVEFDVRRAAGGRLVVYHDPALADGRALGELARDELPASVPDLVPVLEVCGGLDLVNVEIKNWPADPDFDDSLAIAEAVASELMARPAPEWERMVVSCFHLDTIDRVLAVAPDLVTAWLVVIPGQEAGAELVARAVDHGHRAVHPHESGVSPALVELAHAEELAVNTWTCNDPDRIRWLAEAGVDGIITDVPDVALAALGR
jgi:glycerophosphoryl diester phosphodiesterase